MKTTRTATDALTPVREQPSVLAALALVQAARERLTAAEEREASLTRQFASGGVDGLEAQVRLPDVRQQRTVAEIEFRRAGRAYDEAIEDGKARTLALAHTAHKVHVSRVARALLAVRVDMDALVDYEMHVAELVGSSEQWAVSRMTQGWGGLMSDSSTCQTQSSMWLLGARDADLLEADVLESMRAAGISS